MTNGDEAIAPTPEETPPPEGGNKRPTARRIAASFPAPQLSPVFLRSACLADGHLDHIGRAGLARLFDDAFAVSARRRVVLRVGARVFHFVFRRNDLRPRGSPQTSGGHASALDAAGRNPCCAHAHRHHSGLADHRAGAVQRPGQRLRCTHPPILHHRNGRPRRFAQRHLAELGDVQSRPHRRPHHRGHIGRHSGGGPLLHHRRDFLWCRSDQPAS